MSDPNLRGLPKTVTVLGQTYRVEPYEDPHSPMGQHDGEAAACGWTDQLGQLCRIRGHGYQSRMSSRDTMLHEVVHMIDYFVKTPMEESDIARFSSVLLDTLRSNPKLLDFILEPD